MSFHQTPSINHKNSFYPYTPKSRNLNKKQRQIVLVVALSTLLILAIPALIIYIIFKAKALKDSSISIRSQAEKTSQYVQQRAPLISSVNSMFQKETLPQEHAQNVLDTKELEVIHQLREVVDTVRSELQLLDNAHRKAVESLLDELDQPGVLADEILDNEKSLENVKNLRAKLKIAIQRVGLQRELRKKGKVVSALDFELPLLKTLGIQIDDTSNYQNKEFLFQVISQVAENELRNTNLTSFSEIANFFTKIGLKVRLQQVNISDPTQIEKFEHLLKYCQDSRKKYFEFHSSKEFQLPSPILVDKFPQAIKKLHQQFAVFKMQAIDNLLRNALRASSIQAYFENPLSQKEPLDIYLSGDKFNHLDQEIEEVLNIAIQGQIKGPKALQKFSHFLKQRLEFLMDFSPYLAYEFIQGAESKDETFHKGICYALNLSLLQHASAEPQASPEEIRPKIDAKSRFSQLQHDFDIDVERYLGFKEKKTIFIAFKDKRFVEDLREKFLMNDLHASHGWALLSLYFASEEFINIKKNARIDEGIVDLIKQIHEDKALTLEDLLKERGHAISLRIDPLNQSFHLFDPNVGHFDFSQDTNGETLLLQCFESLLNIYYPDLLCVQGNQLIC